MGFYGFRVLGFRIDRVLGLRAFGFWGFRVYWGLGPWVAEFLRRGVQLGNADCLGLQSAAGLLGLRQMCG